MTTTTIDSPGDVSKLFRGYFDYLLGHTFNSPSGSYYWHRKRREVFYLLNHVVQRSPKRQCVGIDLGCGEGTDIFAIRRHLDNSNWKLIGVDAATEGIQLCRIKQEYYNAENIDFGIVDLTSPLPFEDNSLDLVYCSEVVEHLEQPEQLFLEIHRVLQPGAFLILTTPNEPNIFQRSFYSKQRRERIHDEIRRQSIVVNMGNGTSIPIHGHVSLKTIREWDGLLADRGFELVAYRRGAIGYGAGSVFDHEFSLWLRFAMETLIDLLPLKLGRLLSDELIALYQKSTY